MSFAGVNLDEKIAESSATAESAPSGAVSDSAPEGQSPETVSTKAATTEAIKELLDLDKVERFRFDGKEWSPKDLKSSYMMQSDYSRKTKELSETRRFADNFATDLNTVIKYPHRWDEFKKLYPKDFVQAAEQVLARNKNAEAHEVPKEAKQEVDPQFKSQLDELKEDVNQWKQQQYQAEVEKAQAWLDSQYETLSKKYPMADSSVVDALASAAADRGTQITKEILDKLFKDNHDKTDKRFQEVYKTKVDTQLRAGQKGKDIGQGGGTPGSAPQGIKTLKGAKEAMLKDLGV